jgi:hypothetical protein
MRVDKTNDFFIERAFTTRGTMHGVASYFVGICGVLALLVCQTLIFLKVGECPVISVITRTAVWTYLGYYSPATGLGCTNL